LYVIKHIIICDYGQIILRNFRKRFF